MKRKYLATVCAVTFGAAGITFGGGAFAQSPSDMKAQIEALQHQLQILKERLDKQEAQQAKQAAQAPAPGRAAAASGGTERAFLERKEGDGVTFNTRGGEVSLYGNIDLSLDSTTKGISGFTAPRAGFAAPGDGVLTPFGNGGWMNAISSNLSYVGVRGFQTLGNLPMNFVYQLETQIDVSATSGTGLSNSNTSNQVKGGLTSRNSFIGLASQSWGAVKIGKTDAPYKTSTGRMNPFLGMLGDYAVIMGNTGGDNRVEFGTRMEHSIWYESPSWNGINFNALYSPGQNRAVDSSNLSAGASDCAGGNIPGSGGLPGACNDGAFSNAYSTSLSYTNKGLYITGAYEMHRKVNRTSDLFDGTPASYNPMDIGDEHASKLGVQYAFPTKTTVSVIWEDMKRDIDSSLALQNERTRSGYWLALSQGITSKDSLHFGWAHANNSLGDPGQHNTLPLVGLGTANPDNAANMYTLAWKHQMDKNMSIYANWAETVNHKEAHYDLGAGGRGVTTDCHDASNADGTGFDPANGAPRCWAGGHLKGISVGMKYVF
ncbi:MAG TPA: porin [Burkholderiales bacterium]